MKIDIQTIYKCFASVLFLKGVPPVYYNDYKKFINNRVTHQNVRIIKAAIHLCSKELLT